MQQLRRLLSHLRPYSLQFSVSVVLMAAVGLLEAFRILLLGPIIDRVLNPGSPAKDLALFKLPGTQHMLYLQQFIPLYYNKTLNSVALAPMAATSARSIS